MVRVALPSSGRRWSRRRSRAAGWGAGATERADGFVDRGRLFIRLVKRCCVGRATLVGRSTRVDAAETTQAPPSLRAPRGWHSLFRQFREGRLVKKRRFRRGRSIPCPSPPDPHNVRRGTHGTYPESAEDA